jgi:quinol monooxygenase YgiN
VSALSITINIVYHGENGSARAFANEMVASGTVAAIRAEEGNEAYEYYTPLDDPEAILLIDRWHDQEALDVHHASPMMQQISSLREKYDLHMDVRRFTDLDEASGDSQFIRS